MYRGIDASVKDLQRFNRQRYLLGWTIVGAMLLIDLLWLGLNHYTVGLAGFKEKVTVIVLLVCILTALRGVQQIPRYRQICVKLRYPDVSDTLAWYVLLITFLTTLSVLSYLCVAIDRPSVENSLVRFDRTMGFDWLAVYRWVQSHTFMRRFLAASYASGWWQLIAIPAILGMAGRREELSDFFFLIALSSIYLLLISTPFPATSAFEHFKISDASALASVSDFSALRDGSLRTFDLDRMQGLVSLPSYHATLAVIFVYAVRRIPFLFWPAVVLDLAMLASTPTQGGHYLADVFAGLALATLTIGSVTGFMRWGDALRFRVSMRFARHVVGLFDVLSRRVRRFR